MSKDVCQQLYKTIEWRSNNYCQVPDRSEQGWTAVSLFFSLISDICFLSHTSSCPGHFEFLNPYSKFVFS